MVVDASSWWVPLASFHCFSLTYAVWLRWIRQISSIKDGLWWSWFAFSFFTSIVFMLNLVTMIFGVYSIYVLTFHICICIFIFYQELLYTLFELFGIISELRRTALSISEVVFCIMGMYNTPLTWRLVRYNRSHSILILIRPYIGFAHFCLSSSLAFDHLTYSERFFGTTTPQGCYVTFPNNGMV